MASERATKITRAAIEAGRPNTPMITKKKSTPANAAIAAEIEREAEIKAEFIVRSASAVN